MEYQQGKQEKPEYQQQKPKYFLEMNRDDNKDGIKPETIDDKIEVFDVSPDKTIPKKLKKLDRSESCL